jgi:hypothetical protein
MQGLLPNQILILLSVSLIPSFDVAASDLATILNSLFPGFGATEALLSFAHPFNGLYQAFPSLMDGRRSIDF